MKWGLFRARGLAGSQPTTSGLLMKPPHASPVDSTTPILQLKPFPFLAWPPAGAHVPYHLVFPRWHFSLEGFGYELSELSSNFGGSNILGSAKVSMTVKVGAAAATPLAVSVINSGQHYVVFEPSLTWDTSCTPRCGSLQFMQPPVADTTYTVTVSGFSFRGSHQSLTTSSYSTFLVHQCTTRCLRLQQQPQSQLTCQMCLRALLYSRTAGSCWATLLPNPLSLGEQPAEPPMCSNSCVRAAGSELS